MKKIRNISRKELVIDKVKEKKIVEINQEEYNKKCFDCGSLNPRYISLYNAIFICGRCVNNIHRLFNSNISLILNNDLHKLSIKDIQYLYYGGNKTLLEFINYEYPILSSIDRKKLYITQGMDYYRKWLRFLIDDGESPIKPSFEECSQLITDINANENKINTKKVNKNRNSRNIINIDFINNYYNYEDTDNYSTIDPNINGRAYTTNLFNDLNEKRDHSTYYKENELSLMDRLNTEYNNYNNNRTIYTERNNYKYKTYKKINKKIIKIKKSKENINNNDIMGNRLITKKLNLKSKNIFKGKLKDMSMSRNDNSSNIITKSLEINKIYIKPKQSLFTSFKKKPFTRNREDKEDSPGNSYIIPTGNNYQSILINNNNFDKLLMYNFTDRTHSPKELIKIKSNSQLRKRELINSMKLFNIYNYFENTNTKTDSNKEIIFKKKNLRNSFSINARKIKNKKKIINKNQLIENTSFQIIPNKKLNNSMKDHIKLDISKDNNTTYSFDNKKDKDNIIIKEIKVKKKKRYIIENKCENPSNAFSSKKNFETNDNKNQDDKDISKIKNNLTDAKNETNLKKLLNLTRLMKNDKKMSIPNISLSNCNAAIDDKKSKGNKTSRETKTEKESYINDFKEKKEEPKKQGKKIKMIKIEKNNLKENQWEILNYFMSKKNK